MRADDRVAELEALSPKALRDLFDRAVAKVQSLPSNTRAVDPSSMLKWPRLDPKYNLVTEFQHCCAAGEVLTADLSLTVHDSYCWYRHTMFMYISGPSNDAHIKALESARASGNIFSRTTQPLVLIFMNEVLVANAARLCPLYKQRSTQRDAAHMRSAVSLRLQCARAARASASMGLQRPG
ncbi:hypothetical protein WJX73_008008 [Symbiochloris irregularis]|uniref:Uncharacterized protein n=1 Tax=Symbiochloris irregularis TaxID=706552 RepID=A0AAW1PSW7_9CHLO